MAVPILRQRDYLIASVQEALTDQEVQELQADLVHRSIQHRSRGVIVDVSVLDVLDSFATRTLRDTAEMLRLCGAEVVIVGIQPEVAFAMTQLGLTLGSISTALDLDEGIAILNAQVG